MYEKSLKRFIDVILAIIIIPFVLIIAIVISPIIILEDRGPIFYNSYRIGKNGKIFKMYKFRTMKVNAPDIRLEDGSTFNSEDDIRVTKIGKLLRKLSIDELPQVINVLLGNMSFIGPRPSLPDAWDKYDVYEKKKFNVRPGISGYNQAYFRNSIDSEERIMNDIYYVENVSIFFDIKIALKTIISIVKRKNIYVSVYEKEANRN